MTDVSTTGRIVTGVPPVSLANLYKLELYPVRAYLVKAYHSPRRFQPSGS